MTYSRNIARLKESGRANLRQGNAERTRTAQQRGITLESEARDVAIKLSGFSKSLQEWKQEDIKVKEYEGKMQLRREQEERAKTIGSHSAKIAAIEAKREQGELLEEFESAEDQDYAYNELKGKILELQGVDAYPDADRIAKLSPHQQVGYVKEKLRQAKLKYADQLAWTMSNSEEPITIAGVTYTPKQLREKNIQALPFKEAAVNVMAAKLRKSLGIDKYSDAMLKVSGMDDTIQKAKDDLMSKYRERYNIESSMNTQSEAKLDYLTGKKGPKEAARFLLKYGLTVDKNNKLVGNTGALDALFGMWQQQGIQNGGDTSIVDEYANMPLPEALRKKLGKPPGTTFGDQWGPRFRKLRADIKKGHTDAVTQTLKNQNAQKDQITIRFKEASKKAYEEGRTLSTKELNFWKAQYTNVGAAIPNDVKNYETASARNVREDKLEIEAHIATSGYGITHDELNHYHPLAAAEFRKQADAFEKARFQKFGADKIIKGALDTQFQDMGYKDKEKSDVYQIALQNATRDYNAQFNEYVSMGIPEETAHWWALNGPPPDLKNNEGQPMFGGRLGVRTEINQNGEESKYVKAGLFIEKTVGSDLKRARHIMSGKKEMLEKPEIRLTGVIGGDYGRKQLDAIVANIEKYGFYRGIAMSEEHTQYYKGLMAGRNLNEGGWWALLNDQLKAHGHEGISNNEAVQSVLPLLTRKVEGPNGEEEQVEDNDGVLNVSSKGINAANNRAPLLAYNYIIDANNYYNNTSDGSIFDQPDQIPAHLGGTA